MVISIIVLLLLDTAVHLGAEEKVSVVCDKAATLLEFF
jgi:hypothetical protein